MRSSLVWLLVVSLGFAYGLWRLFDLRFASGDIYPPYSSLRADPPGTRALFESLAELPGYHVERNYLPLEKVAQGPRTLFYLGGSAHAFEASSEEELNRFEKLAESGSRVVIAFRTANPQEGEKNPGVSIVEKKWRVEFTYVKLNNPPDRKTTALILTALDPVWSGRTLMERRFGKGSVVLLPLAYPLSNEALQQGPKTDLLLRILGGNKRIVFDENHLGVSQSGSIAALARKYRLQALALALLLLMALFVWKNSSSLLPPRDAPPAGAAVASKYNTAAGLANLLRRNIPPARLPGVCLEEWEKAIGQNRGGRRYPMEKIARVRTLAAGGGDPAAVYREIVAVLAERK